MGRDFTLFALKTGKVKYVKSGTRTIVSIVAPRRLSDRLSAARLGSPRAR